MFVDIPLCIPQADRLFEQLRARRVPISRASTRRIAAETVGGVSLLLGLHVVARVLLGLAAVYVAVALVKLLS